MAIEEKEIKQVEQFLNAKDKSEDDDVAIIFDGKQYSIRIPKRFVESARIDVSKDMFKFTLITHPPHSGKKPELKGEILRG